MIIIKTPQPDTEKRLVLVPPESCTPVFVDGKLETLSVRTAEARDATPADLARAGYVPLAALATANDRAEKAEDCGQDGVCAIAPGCQRHWAEGTREAIARAEKAERERHALMTEAAVARDILQDIEGDDDLRETATRTRAAITRLVSERDALRAELADAKSECAGAMRSAHAQYAETVRERDASREECSAQIARAVRAERERDTLRAELARLSDGGPTYEDFRAKWISHAGHGAHGVASFAREQWRAGVAYERARQQPAKGRATDKELFAIADAVYEEAHGGEIPNGPHEIARRVAARVRRERCLVAQAVAANVDIRVAEDDVGFMVGAHAPGCDEELCRNVPAADVPATLARLAGLEVSRG